MRIIFLLLITLIITASCNRKVKETIGIVTPGPNEYKVQRNKSLEVPPHYNLPLPKLNNTKAGKNNVPKNLNEGEKALVEEIQG